MPSLLARLIHDARSFLSDLAEDNTRAWWQAHRADYDEKLKGPALQLLDEISGPLGRMTGTPIDTKLFRPHRDIRFSKDKTPYNTHLHLLWSPAGSGPLKPGYFFGIAPAYVTLGAGLPDFDRAARDTWRSAVATDGAGFAAQMDALSTSGYRISEPAMKRVPAPYPKDHPQEALLRRKGLSAWRDIDATLTRNQMEKCFEDLTPMVMALAALR